MTSQRADPAAVSVDIQVPGANSDDRSRRGQQASRHKSNFLPSVANFNVQYNFTSASIAVDVLSSSSYLGHALYAEPVWSEKVTLAAVFVGAMVGMLVMGRLGDILGRIKAMRLTLALAVLGALIPALIMGSSELAYSILCFGRFVLGIGVGGIYPLSAVSAAESCGADESRGQRVSSAFFWQCPAILAPFLISMFLFSTVSPQPPAEWAAQLQFRVLFALGVVPALIVFVGSWREEESAEFQQERQARRAVRGEGALTALGRESSRTLWTLVGTSGAWFFYDVADYGTVIFTPAILNDICMTGSKIGDTCQQTLFQTSWQSCITTLMGIPGCLLAVFLAERWGSKRLNYIGFLLLAANFALMALVYIYDKSQTTLLFSLFCLLNFLLCFGPNVGTYVLPAICFPTQIRSTCHGISAFSGKLGAVLGTLFFPVVNASAGLPMVLFIQAAACLLGALVSKRFLRHDWEYSRDGCLLATADAEPLPYSTFTIETSTTFFTPGITTTTGTTTTTHNHKSNHC